MAKLTFKKITGVSIWPFDLVEPCYLAHQAFSELMLSSESQVRFQPGGGDSVMFDNNRVFPALAESSDLHCFLQTCNVSHKTFHERLRLRAGELGFGAEGSRVLAAGMSC